MHVNLSIEQSLISFSYKLNRSYEKVTDLKLLCPLQCVLDIILTAAAWSGRLYVLDDVHRVFGH